MSLFPGTATGEYRFPAPQTIVLTVKSKMPYNNTYFLKWDLFGVRGERDELHLLEEFHGKELKPLICVSEEKFNKNTLVALKEWLV